jgi:hypothetical protein
MGVELEPWAVERARLDIVDDGEKKQWLNEAEEFVPCATRAPSTKVQWVPV